MSYEIKVKIILFSYLSIYISYTGSSPSTRVDFKEKEQKSAIYIYKHKHDLFELLSFTRLSSFWQTNKIQNVF